MALARERRWWCGHPSNVWLPCEPPHDIPPPPCLPTTTESWSGRGRLVNSSLPRISCQEFTVWQKPTSGSFFGLFFQSFFFFRRSNTSIRASKAVLTHLHRGESPSVSCIIHWTRMSRRRSHPLDLRPAISWKRLGFFHDQRPPRELHCDRSAVHDTGHHRESQYLSPMLPHVIGGSVRSIEP